MRDSIRLVDAAELGLDHAAVFGERLVQANFGVRAAIGQPLLEVRARLAEGAADSHEHAVVSAERSQALIDQPRNDARIERDFVSDHPARDDRRQLAELARGLLQDPRTLRHEKDHRLFEGVRCFRIDDQLHRTGFRRSGRGDRGHARRQLRSARRTRRALGLELLADGVHEFARQRRRLERRQRLFLLDRRAPARGRHPRRSAHARIVDASEVYFARGVGHCFAFAARAARGFKPPHSWPRGRWCLRRRGATQPRRFRAGPLPRRPSELRPSLPCLP